ncbi:MAG: hypothetical protein Q9186_000780 [Xanthomendoza sp. 1 TL-2023]
MGNQISAATRKKSGGPLDKELAPVRSESENLSQQETLASRPTFRNRFSRLKPAIPKQMATPSLASSPSLGSSGSVTLHKQSTDTDGASSPKHENFEITLPAPSMKTDIQYLSFSLDAVSPSEASTITQGILNVSSPPPLTPPISRQPSPLPPHRPSSSISPRQQSSSRPLSAASMTWRPHPLFPVQSPRFDSVPAPRLRPIHFACYQMHRKMVCSQNVHHSVPCMSCGLEDDEERWKCVWCCLRICRQCMDTLNKDDGRDLVAVLKRLDGKGRVELYHYPGSARVSLPSQGDASSDEEELEHKH